MEWLTGTGRWNDKIRIVSILHHRISGIYRPQISGYDGVCCRSNMYYTVDDFLAKHSAVCVSEKVSYVERHRKVQFRRRSSMRHEIKCLSYQSPMILL